MRAPHVVALVVALAVAHPLEAEPASPYSLSWAVDVPVATGAAAALVLPWIFADDLVRGGGPYDASSVNRMDRFVTGLHSSGANTASDVMLWSMVALPFAAAALDVGVSSGGGWRGWATDSAVLAEAVLVSAALNQLTKVAVQRPRPLLYDRAAGAPALAVADNHLSFYSGHTSTAFAAGMAWAFTFSRRHPGSPWRYAAYGGAAALGGTVGLLRVLAGKHFVSDVLVGAVAGTLVGVGVPWLHARSGAGVAVAPGRGGGAVFAIAVPLP
jgi:membrane-associated phospholipid phosphatase